MSGKWATSTRRARLPPDWGAIRPPILARDGHRCRWHLGGGILCGAPANNVDHIDPNGPDTPDNLHSLCPPHHARKSATEGAAASAAQAKRRAALRYRKPEKHPGLR